MNRRVEATAPTTKTILQCFAGSIQKIAASKRSAMNELFSSKESEFIRQTAAEMFSVVELETTLLKVVASSSSSISDASSIVVPLLREKLLQLTKLGDAVIIPIGWWMKCVEVAMMRKTTGKPCNPDDSLLMLIVEPDEITIGDGGETTISKFAITVVNTGSGLDYHPMSTDVKTGAVRFNAAMKLVRKHVSSALAMSNI